MSYDAIVVGARCAGAPLAMQLARGGHRVLMVDKAEFPSDVVSTHYIHNSGLARVQRWGLLDRLEATGCPRIPTVRFDFGPIVLAGSAPPADGIRYAYAPRRTVLDHLLVDAAIAAGVEVRESFAVESLLHEAGRVVGIRGRHRHGSPIDERARIVVGADGVHSLVARGVAAPTTEDRPPLTVAYYSYWSGVPAAAAEVYLRPGTCALAFPTHDGLTLVVVFWTDTRREVVRGDVERAFTEALAAAGDLGARVAAGRREERFHGASGLKNFCRRSYGEGWALVGDAGYHTDPLTARGITDAFIDADLLADAIDAGLTGRRPMAAALAERERQRNAAAMPLFELTCERARLEPPPPQVVQVLSALQGNQDAIDRFVGIDAGTTDPAEFFSPANIESLMASASGRAS
jgi:flavin-dependent dehydrogenase